MTITCHDTFLITITGNSMFTFDGCLLYRTYIVLLGGRGGAWGGVEHETIIIVMYACLSATLQVQQSHTF